MERPSGRGRARGRMMVNPESAPGARSIPRADDETASVMTEDAQSASMDGTMGSVAGGSACDDQASVVSTTSEAGRGLRVTLPQGFVKQGLGGQEMQVVCNYLHMNKTPSFQLRQYRVDFKPEEDSTVLKKMLVRESGVDLGAYIFDGHMLYTTRAIPPEKQEFKSSHFIVYMKDVGFVMPDSPMYLQFYNMVMRKCMTLIEMEEVGRHFYNRHLAINFPEDRLTLWPGIITAIRNHEAGMLLCMEVTHKVLRTETVYDMIRAIKGRARSQQDFEAEVKKQLIGEIVLTHYNRKTYKVDDVYFNISALDTFTTVDKEKRPVDMSYKDYYHDKYKITLDPLDQPILVSKPRKRDINKGTVGDIYLFPTLCHPTGLTDTMRKNFTLMQRLSHHLHMGPNQRKQKLDEFVEKLKNTETVKAEFRKWDIDFVPNYITATARQYQPEQVTMGGQNGPEACYGDNKADWTRCLKGRQMLTPVELKEWVLYVGERDKASAPALIDQLRMAARAMNISTTVPIATVSVPDRGGRELVTAIRKDLQAKGKRVEFALIVLPNNNMQTYADVKKLCIMDYKIACQCFLAKNMNKSDPKSKQKLGSICTKVMIQITAKLGGVPWGVKVPVKKMMVLGFDVYHCSERKNQSAGALVSTIDQSLTQYFSVVGFHKDKSELASQLASGMTRSLHAYKTTVGDLPERIMFYRDGVGEGQINYVIDTEVPQMRLAIKKMYEANGAEPPKLSVIIVTKKINSRILSVRGANYDNVPPGTVCDNVITLPERYDFFLVSQSVNQGTVSPTNYNVIVDESGWQPERMQKMSYKLCHLYYNWCGTVAVPAPCQYAHKLAYLTGMSLNDEAPVELATKLWYL